MITSSFIWVYSSTALNLNFKHVKNITLKCNAKETTALLMCVIRRILFMLVLFLLPADKIVLFTQADRRSVRPSVRSFVRVTDRKHDLAFSCKSPIRGYDYFAIHTVERAYESA